MEKKTMGSFIAILRKAKGMTQKELAELLNVSDKAVSRWERDESAPDITLIPVLADIFEVTCDDLLRGEKVGKEAFEETTEKRTHRMKILLKKSRSRFQAFSMISIGVALFGFLIAVVANFTFHKATIGFYCVLCGILAAGISQTAFYLYFKGEVDTEEIDSPELLAYKKYVRDHTMHIGYLLVILLCICLPLLLFGQISYADYIAAMSEAMAPAGFEYEASSSAEAVFPMGKIAIGLLLNTWLIYGGICGLVAAFCCFIVDNLVKYSDGKKKRFGMTEEDLERSKKAMIRTVKYLLVLAVILGITAGVAKVFKQKAPTYFVTGTTFETFEEFKEYMEKVPAGMGWGVEDLRRRMDHYQRYVYGDNGELLCEYTILNDEVIDIKYGQDNMLPITTYTEADYQIAEQKVEDKMWVFSAAMLVECVVVAATYLRSRRKLF